MDYYRCENPDCGFLAGEEPDICPRCGGTFFTPLLEEALSGGDWVWLGNQAVDEKRDTDALACYQRAAALGDDAGLTNLGWCLEAGIGVSADPKQAVVLYAQAAALYRRAAEQGDAAGQCNLGYLYEAGRGVSQDWAQAAKWYAVSAEKGLARAQYHLAWCCEHGKGVPRDAEKALRLYQAAAEQQYEDAEQRASRLLRGREKGGLFRGIFGGRKER